MKKVLILGAAGRDFHNFNVVFRNNPEFQVAAFTAAQIPDIDGRRYPAELAGDLYPDGIPILDENKMEEIIHDEQVDVVVFSYSDIAHPALISGCWAWNTRNWSRKCRSFPFARSAPAAAKARSHAASPASCALWAGTRSWSAIPCPMAIWWRSVRSVSLRSPTWIVTSAPSRSARNTSLTSTRGRRFTPGWIMKMSCGRRNARVTSFCGTAATTILRSIVPILTLSSSILIGRDMSWATNPAK